MMKFTFFLLLGLLFWSTCVHAQEDIKPTKASIGVQYTYNNPEGLGVSLFGEYFLKPNVSIWATGRLQTYDRSLGFGGVSAGGVAVPTERVSYKNATKLFSVKTGVRFYGQSKMSQWSYWASPVMGYGLYTGANQELRDALGREDLISLNGTNPSTYDSYTSLELGIETGVRWSFKPRFYLEGSVDYSVRHKLDLNDTRGVLDLNLGVGWKF